MQPTSLTHTANSRQTYPNGLKGVLSWLGRIHAVKMTLLPRILYLFRAIPINIIKEHLKAFQRKIIKFIWGGKGYRLQQSTLYLNRPQGGLGLPQLFWYYQSARLAQISSVYAKTERPDWIQIERQAVPSFTIDFLLWVPPKKVHPFYPLSSHNPFNYGIL